MRKQLLWIFNHKQTVNECLEIWRTDMRTTKYIFICTSVPFICIHIHSKASCLPTPTLLIILYVLQHDYVINYIKIKHISIIFTCILVQLYILLYSLRSNPCRRHVSGIYPFYPAVLLSIKFSTYNTC